jgi:hypothetical protein
MIDAYFVPLPVDKKISMKQFIMKYILFIFSCLSIPLVYGQSASGYLPVSDFSNAAFTLAVYEVNFEGVQQNSNSGRLPYASIKGSPFYVDQFRPADLFGANGKYSGRMQVKLNMASQEVYFIGEKDNEYVAPSSFSKRVVIFSDNAGKDTLAIFERNIPGMQLNNRPIADYVEEMVDGKVKLYKYTKRYVASADSMFGTLKRYYFANTVHYFLSDEKDVLLIKKMNLSGIADLLGDRGTVLKWAEQNRLNPKREEDLIALIRRWNFEIAYK